MHPWMIEQVAREHRRDLLARAARPRVRPAWTWQKLVGYMTMSRNRRQTGAPTALTPGGAVPATARPGTVGQSDQLRVAPTGAGAPAERANAA
jgi:hypothetical protein